MSVRCETNQPEKTPPSIIFLVPCSSFKNRQNTLWIQAFLQDGGSEVDRDDAFGRRRHYRPSVDSSQALRFWGQGAATSKWKKNRHIFFLKERKPKSLSLFPTGKHTKWSAVNNSPITTAEQACKRIDLFFDLTKPNPQDLKKKIFIEFKKNSSPSLVIRVVLEWRDDLADSWIPSEPMMTFFFCFLVTRFATEF